MIGTIRLRFVAVQRDVVPIGLAPRIEALRLISP